MRALVQRVSRASVEVEGERIAAIGPGLLVLVGIRDGDGEAEADRLAVSCGRCGSSTTPRGA